MFEALKTIAMICQFQSGIDTWSGLDYLIKQQTKCQVELVSCYLAEKSQVELALMGCVMRRK